MHSVWPRNLSETIPCKSRCHHATPAICLSAMTFAQSPARYLHEIVVTETNSFRIVKDTLQTFSNSCIAYNCPDFFLEKLTRKQILSQTEQGTGANQARDGDHLGERPA